MSELHPQVRSKRLHSLGALTLSVSPWVQRGHQSRGRGAGGRCWRRTALAPALVPWDPSVLFTVSWGRVARLGKLACEGNMGPALAAGLYP